jgi:hypothetical protein
LLLKHKEALFTHLSERWAQELQARQLAPLAIRGAIMRKLLHIVFGILRHRQPFNPLLTLSIDLASIP